MAKSTGITGDFSKLKRWEKLAASTPEVMPVIAQQMAEETITLIRAGMDRRQDPYGAPYHPLKFRAGTPLQKTGVMKNAWFRKFARASGFKVSNSTERAAYHQKGTGVFGPKKSRIYPKTAKALAIPTPGGVMFRRSIKGIPKRPMVPNRGFLPRTWKRAYRETVNEVLLSHFRSKA